jgi:hypothetical protein
MVRTVKTKPVRSLTKGQRAILMPGANGAEPWEVWVLGDKTSAQLIQACASPLDSRLKKDTTLALPVSQVFCLPIWVNEADPKQFAGIVPLQIELRGLNPRGNEPAIFDWTVVAQEGARTLLMVGVLPTALSPDIHAEAFESFDLSARYLTFPEDAITLWKEQDRLAFAITRGSKLVYFQGLAEGEITSRVLQDVNCARATLGMQDILAPLQRVVLWVKATEQELATLADSLPLPVDQEERPPPVAPTQAWKLTPATVHEAKRRRETSRWQRRALIAAVTLYLFAAAWMISRVVVTSSKVDELRKWQAEHADAVEQVEDGRATWKELAPVVNTTSYPLELLSHAAASIPADQLHLTLFESGEDHLLIKGEAKNVEGAFQFLAKLKADPYFSSYNLAMGNPRPLPNDLAQFQIEGTHAPTN